MEAEPTCHVPAPDRPSPSGQGPRSGRTKPQQREAESEEGAPGRRPAVGGKARRPSASEAEGGVGGERAAAAEEEPAAEKKPADSVQVSLREATASDSPF